MDEAKINRHWDRNIAGEHDPSQSLPSDRNEISYFSVINPERLHHTGEPVAEMGREQEQASHVKQRNQRMPEPKDEHPVNVMASERIVYLAKFRICHQESELEKMVNDKTEDDQSAHQHRSRGHRRLLGTGYRVFLRLREAIFLCEMNRRHDMDDKRRDQNHSHHPE